MKTSTSYRIQNPFQGLDRYHFNGQEKDDEVYGKGNSTTAEYWQYDSRLGRRWNIDPVFKTWQSPLCTFDNNPIAFSDPHGAETQDPNPSGANPDDVRTPVQNTAGAPVLLTHAPSTHPISGIGTERVAASANNVDAQGNPTPFELVNGNSKVSYYFSPILNPDGTPTEYGYYVEVISVLVDPNAIVDPNVTVSNYPPATLPTGVIVQETAGPVTAYHASLNSPNNINSALDGDTDAEKAARFGNTGKMYDKAASDPNNSNLLLTIRFSTDASEIYRKNVISTLNAFGYRAMDGGTTDTPEGTEQSRFKFQATLTYTHKETKPAVWVEQ